MIDKKKIRKILVVKNDKIGDMLLSTGIFRELRKNFPKAKIDVIVSKLNKELVEKNKNINGIFVLDYPDKINKSFFPQIINYLKFSKKIKKREYDLGIDLRGSIFNILILFGLGGVRYRIGFYNKWFSKYFLNYAYKKDRENSHVTFQRIDLINRALGLNSKNYWPEIATDKKDEEELKKIIKEHKLKKFICLVPLTTKARRWPLKRYDIIIRYMRKNYPEYKVVLIAGPGEEDIKWLAERNPSCIPIVGRNLRVIYLMLKKSNLVISANTGPMHLAWVSEAKLITPIRFSQLEYIRPLGKNSKVLTSYDNKSVNPVTVDDMKKEIDFFLRKRKINKPIN